MIFEVQPAGDTGQIKSAPWQPVQADSPRSAAIAFASDVIRAMPAEERRRLATSPVTLKLGIVAPGAPRHPNGMPAIVHAITVRLG